MVLVQRLGLILPTVQPRREVLRNARNGLQDDQDVGDQTQDGVRGLEMRAPVVEFVVLDDDQPGDGGEDGDVVECRMGVGSLFLLLGRVRGLQDEDGLDEKEEGGGVEELEGRWVSGVAGSRCTGRETLQGARRRGSGRC